MEDRAPLGGVSVRLLAFADITRRSRSDVAILSRDWAAARSALEGRLDPFRQGSPDARNRRDLLDRRVPDPLRRAEDPEERPATLRADARQVVEGRTRLTLRPQVAVVGDRETVRLVAQPLDQVERG